MRIKEKNRYKIIKELTGKTDCVYGKLTNSAINNHNSNTDTFLHFGKGNPFNSNLNYKLEPKLLFKEMVTDGNLPPLGRFQKRGND